MTHESGQIEHYPLMTTTSGVGKSGYIQQPFGIGTTNSSGHCNANMNMADWRTLMGVTRIRSQLTQKPQQLYGYEYIWNTPQCSKNPWGEWVPPSGYWPAVAIHPSIHSFIHIHIHIHNHIHDHPEGGVCGLLFWRGWQASWPG